MRGEVAAEGACGVVVDKFPRSQATSGLQGGAEADIHRQCSSTAETCTLSQTELIPCSSKVCSFTCQTAKQHIHVLYQQVSSTMARIRKRSFLAARLRRKASFQTNRRSKVGRGADDATAPGLDDTARPRDNSRAVTPRLALRRVSAAVMSGAERTHSETSLPSNGERESATLATETTTPGSRCAWLKVCSHLTHPQPETDAHPPKKPRKDRAPSRILSKKDVDTDLGTLHKVVCCRLSLTCVHRKPKTASKQTCFSQAC